MNGFLIINKPAGITSHDVVNYVRRILKVGLPTEALAKVGHAGTLDPFAAGVLLVAVGNTTRLLEYTKDWSKTYEAEVTLGATSDTDDLTGVITPLLKRGEVGAAPGEETVQKALQSFLGPIQQIPPAYAAIKVKGRKLYEYARRGETVERKPRPVIIHSIKLLSYAYPLVKLEVHCGAGTYMRALARDIGEKLGTGGYVSRLERKSIHKFHISMVVALDKLSTDSLTSYLLPPEGLLEHLPRITLSPDNVAKWRQGKTVKIGGGLPSNQPIATFNKSHHLLGIGRFDIATSLLRPQKVL